MKIISTISVLVLLFAFSLIPTSAQIYNEGASGQGKVSSVKAQCDPSDDQIALYEDENFGGQCVIKSVGAYANPESIGLPNDSITSLRVGANVSVTLYQDNEFGGVDESFTADDANLGDNIIGNDTVSSVKVECDPSDDQIALYEDENFGGQCVVKSVGAYANPESIGLPNDSITALRVGANVSATLCRDNDFGGVCESFTADDANLGDNTIGNDTVSSARVAQSGVIYLPLVQTK